MSADRELLELAAKAAGIELVPYTWDQGAPWGEHEGFTIVAQGPDEWDPLTDNGDAFGLQVRLRFHVCIFTATDDGSIKTPGFVEVWREGDEDPLHVGHVEGQDYEDATRRAIVRAAAEVGRGLRQFPTADEIHEWAGTTPKEQTP